MPFNASGVYTPPTGSENAAPGQVIQSAIWNSIFTDIATALTQLGQAAIVNGPRIISGSGDITVAATDNLILIQNTVNNITLPASATKTGPVIIIGNAAGIFSSHNSTLLTTGGETIDGLASGAIVLKTDYQSIKLIPLAAGGWVTQ